MRFLLGLFSFSQPFSPLFQSLKECWRINGKDDDNNSSLLKSSQQLICMFYYLASGSLNPFSFLFVRLVLLLIL